MAARVGWSARAGWIKHHDSLHVIHHCCSIHPQKMYSLSMPKRLPNCETGIWSVNSWTDSTDSAAPRLSQDPAVSWCEILSMDLVFTSQPAWAGLLSWDSEPFFNRSNQRLLSPKPATRAFDLSAVRSWRRWMTLSLWPWEPVGSLSSLPMANLDHFPRDPKPMVQSESRTNSQLQDVLRILRTYSIWNHHLCTQISLKDQDLFRIWRISWAVQGCSSCFKYKLRTDTSTSIQYMFMTNKW